MMNVRTLAVAEMPSTKVKGATPGRPGKVVPQPPKKPPPQRRQMAPAPPEGPPPAHAIILAGKAAAFGIDADAIMERTRPPPALPPMPPMEALPSFVRRVEALEDEYNPQLAAKVAQVRAAMKQPGKPADKPPRPVPIAVVQATSALVWVFTCGSVAVWCSFIIYYGRNMAPSVEWATYGATVVGVTISLGLFETMKCVVIACVNLVQDDTVKREAELETRRMRMALKAQRFKEKSRWRPRGTSGIVATQVH